MDTKNYLNVGYISKTRGLKGVVKIKSTSYFSPTRYQKGNKLYLHNEKTDELKIVHASTYSTDKIFDIVSFEEINDITEAEKYIGWAVLVNKDEIPPLPKDVYYYSDLENLKCLDEDNNYFGDIISVVDYTAQTSFKIKLLNGKTILVPFVDFFVKKVDLDNKSVIIHVIPGLLD